MNKVYLKKTEYAQLVQRISDSIPVVKEPTMEPKAGNDIMKKLARVNRRIAVLTSEYRDDIDNELIPALKASAQRYEEAEAVPNRF